MIKSWKWIHEIFKYAGDIFLCNCSLPITIEFVWVRAWESGRRKRRKNWGCIFAYFFETSEEFESLWWRKASDVFKKFHLDPEKRREEVSIRIFESVTDVLFLFAIFSYHFCIVRVCMHYRSNFGSIYLMQLKRLIRSSLWAHNHNTNELEGIIFSQVQTNLK